MWPFHLFPFPCTEQTFAFVSTISFTGENISIGRTIALQWFCCCSRWKWFRWLRWIGIRLSIWYVPEVHLTWWRQTFFFPPKFQMFSFLGAQRMPMMLKSSSNENAKQWTQYRFERAETEHRWKMPQCTIGTKIAAAKFQLYFFMGVWRARQKQYVALMKRMGVKYSCRKIKRNDVSIERAKTIAEKIKTAIDDRWIGWFRFIFPIDNWFAYTLFLAAFIVGVIFDSIFPSFTTIQFNFKQNCLVFFIVCASSVFSRYWHKFTFNWKLKLALWKTKFRTINGMRSATRGESRSGSIEWFEPTTPKSNAIRGNKRDKILSTFDWICSFVNFTIWISSTLFSLPPSRFALSLGFSVCIEIYIPI